MNPKSYQLKTVQVVCGIGVSRTSAVTLEDNYGEVVDGFAEGDGPVAATYNAVNEAILRNVGLEKSDIELTDFFIKTLGHGPEAEGKATVSIRGIGRAEEFFGTGTSTDIVAAGAIAYVNALNRLLAAQVDAENNHS